MKRPEIRYALLAPSLALLASIAIAQSSAPSSNSDTYARPAGRTIADAPARDSDTEFRDRTITPVNAPANVLDGEPRDLRDEQPRTWCTNDPLTGKTAVDCRRWSEIASAQGIAASVRSKA